MIPCRKSHQLPLHVVAEEMADNLARTGGGMVIGRGGTGNSHLIKLLKPKLEKQGYKVICIAFTHVAVANVDDEKYLARTIRHILHRFVGKQRAPKEVICVDNMAWPHLLCGARSSM